MSRRPKAGTSRNEPFCGIPLVPFDGVAIIHGELVMKVVISLAQSDDGGEKMISWRQLVVEGRFTQIMCEGIHTECGLQHARNVNVMTGYSPTV